MRRGILILAVAVAAAAGPAAIAAEPPTQDEYIAEVEAICESNTATNKALLAGIRDRIKAGKRKEAARRFARAANAFGKTTRQIAAVPRPVGYETRLAKWISRLRLVEAQLRKIGKAVRAHNQVKLVRGEVKLRSSGVAANNTVYDFPFDYCRVTPSRFR